MAILKHVGKHNNKKLFVVRRTVPNENHMALVVYTDSLPSKTHDDIMKALESPQGQTSVDLDEVLFRTVTDNGVNLLQLLHKGGLIKKVQTSQVIMTVSPTNSIRLDELNKLLAEMGVTGKEAMERKDAEQGLRDPAKIKNAVAYAGKEATIPVVDTPAGDVASMKEEVARLTETISNLAKVATQLEQKVNAASDVSNGEKEDPQA